MEKRVAVIGYSFRFPGCDTESFWPALLEKRDLVTEVDDQRWSKDAYLHPDKKHSGTSYTFAAGSLGDVAGFDAAFFGLSPREVMHMDPQQRMLLELSWEALERSGTPPSRLRGSNTGVFIGIASVDYGYRYADDLCAVDTNTATGTAPSIASNRISYLFDLHGPSISMDTACSSSMVAFHQACRAIISGEADQALTGGVSLHLHPMGFLVFSKATMLSPDGRCKVFDESGNGYVRSEGAGMFYLKDYDKAVADGDPILAVVAGSAVNTDGFKSGLTVPNADAQIALMRSTYERAGISPDELDYLEAHGTGTAVGDPIETRAIGEALGRARRSPLPIGSVKSNLGHLETASGVAGLAKALLAIEKRKLPATISMKTPNPAIRFDEWNIEVVTDTRSLPVDKRLTIGVNSFGFGGANAHVILQSPPSLNNEATSNQGVETGRLPLCLSARRPEALRELAGNLAETVKSSTAAFYDLCWSAWFRRERHEHSLVLFAQSAEEVASGLKAFCEADKPESVFPGRYLKPHRKPVFVYSGNGCQWQGMGHRLLAESPTFRDTIEEVDRLLRQYTEMSVLEVLSAEPGSENLYDKTEIAQPALFALQVAITRWLRAQGIEPAAVTGHSVGEVAAAWACGALTLEQAVEVIYIRSYYQGKTAGQGQMTAVAAGADVIAPLLQQTGMAGVELAGINSSRGITLAGDVDALARLEQQLGERSIRYKRLPLDYAFHSAAMDSIETGVCDSLSKLAPVPTRIPFISSVTGGEVDGAALGAEYWWHNIRKPVLFEAAIGKLLEGETSTLIEIGAHPVLRGYLNDALRDSDADGCVIATLSRHADRERELWRACAETLQSGAEVDLSRWFPVDGHWTSLPTYPWQRQSLWRPTTSESLGLLQRRYVHPLLGYALPNESTWEAQLDTGRIPWLADHVVGDGTVFPGAGYVELALAVAEQSADDGTAVFDIESLEIRAPLLLDAVQSKVVRTRFDAHTGQISIQARAHAESHEWTEHAKARRFEGTCGSLLSRLAPRQPDRAADFTRETHLVQAESIGLEYGPAFQAVSHGWIEGESVIGVCECGDAIRETAAGMLLHPGILDSAFQLFIPLLEQFRAEHEGLGFVPVQVERLQLDRARAGSLPALIQVSLVKRSPHSLLADVELFDNEGHATCVLTGVRFRAVPLRKNKRQEINTLDYRWIASPLTPGIAAEYLESAIRGLAANEEISAPTEYATELEPLLDALALAGLHEALLSHPRTIEDIPEVARQWFELALDAGWLCAEDDGALRVTEPPEIGARELWELMVRDYPAQFPLTLLVGRFALHLNDWIAGNDGEIALDDKVFSALCRSRLEAKRVHAWRESLVADVERLSTSLPVGQRASIVELGAGEPLFVPSLGDHIDYDRVDLAYLTPSSHAVSDVRQQLREHPLVSVQHIGSNSADAFESLPPIDLAVMHLDFLEASQAVELLETLRKQLSPGGRLLLLGHHPANWLAMLLALYPRQSALESPEQHDNRQWRQLLNELGYADVTQLPGSADAGYFWLTAGVGEQVVPARELSGPAVLLADKATEKLAAALESRSAGVVEICHSVDALAETVAHLHETGEQEAVMAVMLAGLGQADYAQRSLTRCALARDLMLALEATQGEVDCMVVTTGVGAALGCEQADAAGDESLDVPLWGFTRTLQNEASGARMRLVDLPRMDAEEQANLLLSVLAAVGQEDEQVLDLAGNCYVPRLREMPLTDAKDEAEDSRLVLGFDQPGQLRNLSWYPKAHIQPGQGEVAVQVRATGLNFRDVMYSLGLLSDEAIENGFSGPTLGLEFSGCVTAIGDGVTEFSPGDAVVGFGPASFSTGLTVATDTLTRIPEGVSFEAAATIPTTFFTVYYALKQLARLQPGERVLIHGAAGGVGLAAIQIARLMGAEVIATVGSPQKRDVVRLLGVDQIYDSRSLSFAEEILADSGGLGVDVVLNSLADEAINQNLRVLRPFGRFLELGKRDFYENTAIGLRPFRNNISYFGIDSDQLMKVLPDLTRTLFREMMALFEQGELFPLPYTAFPAPRVVDAFRYMQQARQIGKVVVTYQQLPSAKPVAKVSSMSGALQLKADKTYLVTGGLSGFGLQTAQWLVEHGARHLALLSRRGQPGEEERAQFEALTRAASVETYACDVSDREALAVTLQTIGAAQPPLAGVVHAATVFADALAVNMSDQQIAAVLGPKAYGAQYLHELTRDNELDLFVLFSSATTLFGNPGQSNYVAANLALEALTLTRRSQGLAATCVRWGAIDDVGYLARNEQIKSALQGRMGGQALTSTAALSLLEQMLVNDVPMRAVMELDWHALARFLPNAQAAKYREIALNAGEKGSSSDQSADFIAYLMGLSEAEQVEAVRAQLTQSLSQILLLPEEDIGVDQSVYDLGFDSLMGVELMTEIENRFGVQLPAMAISESPTIAKLSDKLLERLRGGEDDTDVTVDQVASAHGVASDGVDQA